MCQSKAEGGRRCPSHLRQMRVGRFAARDSAWLQDEEGKSRNAPASVLDMFGEEYGSAALNIGLVAVEAEPQVTGDILVVVPSSWSSTGLEDRVKSPESIARKLIKETGEVADEIPIITSDFHDALRYTYMAPNAENFTEGVKGILTGLIRRGYVLHRIDNSFLPGNTYMGLHAISGNRVFTFDIRFHTQQSYQVKKTTDALYHKVRDPDTDPEDVRANRDQMRTASAQVVIPDGLG